MSNIKEEINIKKLYGEQCTLPKDEFIKKYNITEKGLSSEQAQKSLESNGTNQISQTKPKQWYNYLFESLFSAFNSILLGITLVLIYTDIILPETPSYANIIVILVHY